jgi:hypothetical protein
LCCLEAMPGLWLLVFLLLVLLTPPIAEAAALQCRTLFGRFAASAVLAFSAAGGLQCTAAASAEPIPNAALRSFNEGFEAYQQGQWVRCFENTMWTFWCSYFQERAASYHSPPCAAVTLLGMHRVLQSNAFQQRSMPGLKLQLRQMKQLRCTS